MYDLGDDLLMVASDRISTYDVVHPTPIPDKGKVLTALSVFWFEQTGDIVPNHLVSATEGVPGEVRGRALRGAQARDAARRVRRARLHHRARAGRTTRRPAPSAGIALPAGLQESEQLPEPIFTPVDEGRGRATTRRSTSTRAAEIVGDRELAGAAARRRRSRSTRSPPTHARERGVILADTKFEFGLDAEGELVLGDEVLTPDSSRFWPADGYEAGPRRSRASTSSTCATGRRGTGWDKTPPAPAIPDDVVAGDARALRRGLRAASPASRSTRGSSGSRRREGRACSSAPRPGILDPQGQSRSSARCPRSASRASPTSTSAGWSSSTSRTPAQLEAMCEKLLANPLIEDYEIVRSRVVRFGVVRFPGSCDEVDALRGRRARRRRRAAVARRPRPARASTRSSSPAASPTATTCASARSRASRR